MQAEGFTTSPAAIAALTIAVQLIGSAQVIHGRFAWFGAGMLAVFTLATIPIVHDRRGRDPGQTGKRGTPHRHRRADRGLDPQLYRAQPHSRLIRISP